MFGAAATARNASMVMGRGGMGMGMGMMPDMSDMGNDAQTRKVIEEEALEKLLEALPETGGVPFSQIGTLIGDGGWNQVYQKYLGSLASFVKRHSNKLESYMTPGNKQKMIGKKGCTMNASAEAFGAGSASNRAGKSTLDVMFTKLDAAVPSKGFQPLSKVYNDMGETPWERDHVHLGNNFQVFVKMFPNKFVVYDIGADEPVVGRFGQEKPRNVAPSAAASAPQDLITEVYHTIWRLLPDSGAVTLPELSSYVAWNQIWERHFGAILPFLKQKPNNFYLGDNGSVSIVARGQAFEVNRKQPLAQPAPASASKKPKSKLNL
eukprot:NODE_4251_length_1093_cov_17.129897_g4052_i0.p1 GENE.NODE_4251_length_1093_cov_17.129897_g4052_i0~~NODE_4251_length_1093_cov_17.129897_g4052_i0.p1  ORF type:complete len:321 (-),score=54.53 NODE_4251_length_1093_cov_17.129897_g4052_i0:69-1031(-)